MKVLAVCVGEPEARPGKKSKTGINKHAQTAPTQVGFLGLAGDAICNRKYHGGPDQAVYIEGDLDRRWWEEELGRPIAHGFLGENLCLERLDNRTVAAGDRFIAGELIIEVTAPRMPCRILADKMNDAGFAKRYIQAARPGFYCRVIRPGFIVAGNLVQYQPFDGERILMSEIMRLYGKKASPDLIERYPGVPLHTRLLASLSRGMVKF